MLQSTSRVIQAFGPDLTKTSPSPDAATLVSLQGVAVDYGRLRVLQPTDLAINEGEFLTILGPSGSGKTTILKILGGFLSPTEGGVHLGDRDLTNLPPERRPFNTVFQDYALFPHMTVAENVAYSLRVRKIGRAERLNEADRALELVGLGGFGARRIAQLSGGQQQRVALARAIVAKPKLILLDEPLSALDAALRHQMQSFLKSIQKQLGTTFVFVTHDQQEALAMSDRIVVMSAGRVAQVGSPAAIYHEPANGFVATFIGRNNLVDAAPISEEKGSFETALGVIHAIPGRCVTAGQRQVAFRPEVVSIRRRHPDLSRDHKNRVEGVIQEITFAGTHHAYSVAAGPDRSVMVESTGQADPANELAVGDEVELFFEPCDVKVIAK